uniref:C2H2-type domain-containing protein n=1 Tax=Rhinopithecus roxellana TaxID=61622 RepID=A0A2K6NDQ4_RHIRO
MIVTKSSVMLQLLQIFGESIMKRDHTSVINLADFSDIIHNLQFIGELMLERNLTNVMIVARSSKPHKCDDCGKAFTSRSHIIRRQRMHTGQKSYKCHQCAKVFSLTSLLAEYQKIRFGGSCSKCNE